MIVFNH